MKRIFRRNQIIITTLAVMIAAAGYLNYSSKKEVAGAEVYEAGMMDISDSDILAENQAKSGVDDGSLTEIASLDGDGEEKLPDGNEVAAVPESAEVSGSEAAGEETAAAGIENPGEVDVARIQGTSDMKRICDLKGNPLLLFINSWSVGMVEERNPGLRLAEFGRN